MASTPLRTMAFASLLVTFTLAPLPASALPVTRFTMSARQNAYTPVDHGVIFDIAFSLAFLGCAAWLASRWTAGAQPADFLNRLCAVPVALSGRLAVFCRSAFVERAAATNNANAAFVPRRGGASYPIASIPGGLYGGGKFVGATRGSGDRPGGIVPLPRSS